VVDAASVAAHPRHEAFLALGALQSIPEVDRVAGMQLSVVAHPRIAVAADHDPIDLSDRPYRSYNVGDIITVPNYGTGTSGQRVRALTGAEDENGEVTYSPELGDLLLEEQERMMLAVKKMSDGTLEGESAVAQPTRVYVPAIMAKPVPKVKDLVVSTSWTSPGFTSGESEILRTLPGGETNLTLKSFKVTVPYSNQVDGSVTQFLLWQHVGGGDGNHTLSEINLGIAHDAGTYTAPMFSTATTFGPENGISFEGWSQGVGTFHLEAIFTGASGAITLGWSFNA
jgi:hypothetical protein